ncbi:baseplate J/gp47 family protein [Nitrobacter sp.]|uniref:baseplate J/gp47 family protein n=1 Tax=Nitrobacter sp. TaxID=29420 RepID=UPI003F64F1B7
MYALPSLADLATKARQAFRANLKGSDAWLWPNNVYASAKVIAGMTFEVFGFASYISRQIFAHTAPDLESLQLHGAEFGIPQKPAAPAAGKVDFAATDAVAVDAGALLRRADGIEYIVQAGGSIATAGTLTLNVIAAVDGLATNAEGGTSLEIVSGVTGPALAAVNAAGITLGVDVEDIESYRARILFRKRNPPHGGAASDYVMWAQQVAGVTRVYVERLWNGPGTVRVFVLMDDLFPDGIPDAASVQRVADYIETVRPAGALVTIAAPVAVPVDTVIAGLSPDTAAVRSAVVAELKDAFFRKSRVAGNDSAFDSMPYLASPTSFSRSWIWQAVANASGEERHGISLPAGDVALVAGQIATLGAVNFA